MGSQIFELIFWLHINWLIALAWPLESTLILGEDVNGSVGKGGIGNTSGT